MSRIYFHSPSAEAEVLGSERAYMGQLCNRIAFGAADLDSLHTAERLASLIRPGHYMAGRPYLAGQSTSVVDDDWSQNMAVALNGLFGGDMLVWKGRPISGFSLVLNTALVLGGDVVKLAARLHGQCEIYAFVEGPNRKWLADIIRTGLDANVLRGGGSYEPAPGEKRKPYSTGWTEVIDLLLARDDEPVVTSYSVCTSFPNANIGDWLPPWPEGVPRKWDALTEAQQSDREASSDTWYDLDAEAQWRISLAGLRSGHLGVEMKPDNWQAFRFRHTLSYLDLLAPDYADRLDAAELEAVAEEELW